MTVIGAALQYVKRMEIYSYFFKLFVLTKTLYEHRGNHHGVKKYYNFVAISFEVVFVSNLEKLRFLHIWLLWENW